MADQYTCINETRSSKANLRIISTAAIFSSGRQYTFKFDEYMVADHAGCFISPIDLSRSNLVFQNFICFVVERISFWIGLKEK